MPLVDLQRARSRRHTLVDPFFKSLGRFRMFFIRRRYPCFEFSDMYAHDFLDKALSEGLTYRTIRLDMPYTGIIDEESDFPGLCKKLYSILLPAGHLLLLTDYRPDKPFCIHKFSDTVGTYRFLAGRSLDDLSYEEQKFIEENLREVKTANIVKCLKDAGFFVEFLRTDNPDVISRSETAGKRNRAGKDIYLTLARKTGKYDL